MIPVRPELLPSSFPFFLFLIRSTSRILLHLPKGGPKRNFILFPLLLWVLAFPADGPIGARKEIPTVRSDNDYEELVVNGVRVIKVRDPAELPENILFTYVLEEGEPVYYTQLQSILFQCKGEEGDERVLDVRLEYLAVYQGPENIPAEVDNSLCQHAFGSPCRSLKEKLFEILKDTFLNTILRINRELDKLDLEPECCYIGGECLNEPYRITWEVVVKVKKAGSRFFTLAIFEHIYMMYAVNTFYTSSGFTYDTKLKKVLTLKDILATEWEALEPVLQYVYTQEWDPDCLEYMTFTVEPNGFTFSSDGIQFYYSSYQLGPRACSPIILSVPWKHIQPYLNQPVVLE